MGTRTFLIWGGLALAVTVPLAAAATSPLLAWRDPIYIAAGFAGIVAMGLMLVQPLLAGGYLPGLSALSRRQLHRWIGSILITAVVIHVAALWITSPPDVIDALTFNSPTPFSAWGVIAMWVIFAAALLAAFHRRLRLRPQSWRLGHTGLASIAVTGSVVHAMLIEGTMEAMSKTALCVLVLLTSVKVTTSLWARAINMRRDAQE